jgi:hypothetical protein
MTDLANLAAATAAGYKLTEHDTGVASDPKRFKTTLAKWITGGAAEAGFEFRADGFDSTSQANARTNAVAALNGARKLRWGAGATANKDLQGNTLTIDVT